jgi:hypothetical protein
MYSLTRSALIALVAVSLSVGCASQDGGDPSAAPAGAESDLTALEDNALQGKLRGILKDVEFMSEADAPYAVFEGDVTTASKLNTKAVRQGLQAAVKRIAERDIVPARVRSERLNVSSVIADGEGADAERHDRQLSIALKTMRANLKSVVGFTFGTSASGDQDEEGPVVYVYVGISKKSGKLIAILTTAVYT